MKNPVMFVLEVVSVLTTVILVRDIVTMSGNVGFEFQIVLWLWFTVLFANFAEAIAEGRGKAQADALRRTRTETQAKLLIGTDRRNFRRVPGTNLRVGDVVVVEAGDTIPSDGEVVEGIASVNEAAITGESAPVIRESGGDRSAVTGGTQVLSDWIKVRITAAPGSTFIDRMIKLVEGAERQKTPNEIALNILLVGLTIIFVFATATIPSYVAYAGGAISVVVLAALFVTLDPHHDRRAAVGDRHRRVWTAWYASMCWRRPAARSRPPAMSVHSCWTRPAPLRSATGRRPIQAHPGRERTGTRGCGAARFTGRRDSGGAFHRRACEGKIRHPGPRSRRAARQFHPVHGAEPNERGRGRQLLGAQGRGGGDLEPPHHAGVERDLVRRRA